MMPLAVITGASSGIGTEFARQLASRGYSLLLVARRAQRLAALAGEFRAEWLAADLADEGGLRAVEQRIAEAPHCSMLVNNAGFGLRGRFFEAALEEHERMHRVHVIATMRLCHAALRRMVQANSGRIINVSSVAGFTASPGGVSYSATKAWMNNFTEGLHLELRARGSEVRVQALCPGFTRTEFHASMGMDAAAIPTGWWCSAESVVRESLDSERLFVVPGWRYKALVSGQRLVPRAVVRAASIYLARRYKKSV